MESFLATRHLDWLVYGVSAFKDNYLWAIVHSPSKRCLLVDPGCATRMGHFLNETGLHVSGILVTHHHSDHIGGISDLVKPSVATKHPIPVFGPDNPHIPCLTQAVHENDTLHLLGLAIQVLDVPGHTADHKAYVISLAGSGPSDENTWLFCGDTLFSGGCGRLFEGTHPQMHASLQKLKQLPPDTQVFCAHEYTLNNLTFELAYAPHDVAIQQRMIEVKRMRAEGQSTIPTRLSTELASNLFLNAPDVQAFKAVRLAKDHFQG